MERVIKQFYRLPMEYSTALNPALRQRKGGAVARAAFRFAGCLERSGGREVDGLGALAHAVRLDVEGDLLAVDEGAHARRLDGGDVDEHVLRAAVRRDEAEALGGVEEFHGAGLGH